MDYKIHNTCVPDVRENVTKRRALLNDLVLYFNCFDVIVFNCFDVIVF